MNRTTPRELMEKHGLQIFDDIRHIEGRRTNQTIVTNPRLTELLGIRPGTIVAMPPWNLDCRQISLQRAQEVEAAPGEHTGITRWVENQPLGQKGSRWLYRCEAPHWQTELSILTDIFRVEDHQQAETLYTFFDNLKALMEPMLEAAWKTRRWPQSHRTETEILEVLQNPRETIGLHQRYG